MTLHQLPVLVLNPYGRCNCRCKMCDIWKETTPSELHAEDLERQLASIERLGVAWVVLSGGEALMHPELWRMTAALRRRHIRITLLSSGLLLAREASRIIENVDDLIVSLDGPPRVHDSIRGVVGAFRALEQGLLAIRHIQPEFLVSARCTVQMLNAEHLCETVATAQNLGLQSISFLAADLTSPAFNRPNGWSDQQRQEVGGFDSANLASLEREIEALIRQRHLEFVRESPDKLRRIARHFRTARGLEQPASPRCNAPWMSAVIEANGDVRPCFFHRPIGTLRSGLPLDAILNSPEAIAFRSSLDIDTNPICRQCVCSLDWKGTA